MDSILTSIKKLLGIDEDYEQFDVDLIMHINSVMAILTQLGVGPENGFSIHSKDDVWSDFLSDSPRLGFVKSYVNLKVRLLFDPPTGSALIEAIDRQIGELEWRILAEAESAEN